MSTLTEIGELLQKGRAKECAAAVQQALDEGLTAKEVLNDGLMPGMNIIGKRFKNNEIYVPEVLIAARAMNAGITVIRPLLVDEGVEAAGTVVLGTVKGDLHDIGKNLVKMMMEGKGLKVIDLGTDVAPEAFIQAVQENNAQVIALSALLTTTMTQMKDVVEHAANSGIRETVKIMIGGAPVTDNYCRSIGADGYAPDATSAAEKALEFCTA